MPSVTEAGRLYLNDRLGRGEIQPGSAKRIRIAIAQLAEVCGDCRVDAVDREIAQDWLAWLEAQQFKLSYRQKLWSHLHVFMEWCIDEEWATRNPFRRVKPPKPPRMPPRGLSRDQVGALLRVVPDLRGRLIVLLMVQQGLRCAGVAGLRCEDLDLEARTMRVREKFGNERVLPITDECFETLEEYLERWPCVSGPVVRAWSPDSRLGGTPTASRRPVAASSVSKWVGEWLYDAGVKRAPGDGIGAHSLRHTCATDMIEAGADLVEVRDTLGHSSVATTNRYLGSAAGRLGRAMGGRRYGASLVPLVPAAAAVVESAPI